MKINDILMKPFFFKNKLVLVGEGIAEVHCPTQQFCSMIICCTAQFLEGLTQSIGNGNVGVEPGVQLGWPVFCFFLPLFASPWLQVPP